MNENVVDGKGITAYPLTWPASSVRTMASKRVSGPFQVSFTTACTRMRRNLEKLGAESVIISTNVPVRKDGLPYSVDRRIDDPGVAIYFRLKKRPMSMACDKYSRINANAQALNLTIDAILGIERWGTTDMMERAFTGFMALPAPIALGCKKDWWEALECRRSDSYEIIKAQYYHLAAVHHPDRGGTTQRFQEITHAWGDFLAEWRQK